MAERGWEWEEFFDMVVIEGGDAEGT